MAYPNRLRSLVDTKSYRQCSVRRKRRMALISAQILACVIFEKHAISRMEKIHQSTSCNIEEKINLLPLKYI